MTLGEGRVRKGAGDISCQVMRGKKPNLKENKCQKGGEEEGMLSDGKKNQMEEGHSIK